ncbi:MULTISPECIES: autotransporter outer membrane beta-barrel domain-containing protein [unclassified Fusobacterium]|uniref:autotransporter outer membrane beta-barrel domain-containing protein n=1 Tax=unclassified Fusobacterium TaxID=2648384 RepID=UPI001B8D04F0|nr:MULTISPECIES: autotransporter outer membrane beta-barrel domain-containing protein [unclassified Fusobacterium]MBR8700828.1 hypothetical protein [Fusobacterium sp. DD45]MBR8710633.1 hypothetical protein [Fusobacterium sp. DD28]MBR8751178.1 hypothetical protein [Fusobacterium sp. DD26]
MNKKKMLLIMLLSSMSAYASYYSYNPEPHTDYSRGFLWGDTRTPRFRIPAGYEFETTNKLTAAYQNFLRFLDEENREKGIDKRYVKENFGEVPEYSENLEYVPLWIEQYNPGIPIKGSFTKYFTKDDINRLIANPDKNPDLLASIPKLSVDESKNAEYRLYFGSGNQLDNFIFENKATFDHNKNNKNVKHLVDGTYEVIGENSKLNLLDITEEEYKQNFLDNNGNPLDEKNPKLVNFIKEKLEGISRFAGKIKEKGGELYITENGKDRKIFHNTYRISLSGDPQDDSKDNWYLNLPLTKVVAFKPYEQGHELVYTSDSIIVRDIVDPLSQNTKIMAKKDIWPYEFEYIDVAPAEKVFHDELKSDYINLKNGKLSEADFKKRWSLSQADLESDDFTTTLPEIYKNDSILKKFNENKDKLGYDLSRVFFPFWGSVDQAEAAATYNGETEEAKKFMRDQKIDLATFQKLIEDTKALDKKIKDEDIENKISRLTESLSLKRIANNDLLTNVSGRKMVKFGGIARINKLIDLGEGYNILMITENNGTYTGKYGTNLTLAPTAQLKNIDVVGVGGQESAKLGNSGLSGITSLNIEVDTNKFDDKGYLYQHALKGTWEPLDKKDENGKPVKPNRIVFRKGGEFALEDTFRNDFVVQMNTSDISKDGSIIDMGRPLIYKDDMDGYEYKLSLIPDTVVQELKVLPNKDEFGNDLVQVKYKDSIKILSNDENKVYKSMVSSGQISSLKDTLTTRNKKTEFSTPEADKANEEKNMRLAVALKDTKKTVEDILKELPEVNINDQDLPRIKGFIEELKKSSDVKKAQGMSRTLAKYKKIDTSKVENELKEVRDKFDNYPENIYKFISTTYFYSDRTENEKARDEFRQQLLEKFGSEENILAEVAKIRNMYREDVKKLYDEIKKAEPDSSLGEEEIGKWPYPGQFLRGDSYETNPGLMKLIADDSTDPIDQLLNLISSIRAYSNQLKAFSTLNEYDNVDEELLASMETNGLFKQIRPLMFYTKRQAETIAELKILLSQIHDNNIYAKVNKISKNEINTYTPVILSSHYDFDANKTQTNGGAISGRYAKDTFKGTIYTGYAIYEKPIKNNLTVGLSTGGSQSNFHEIVNDDIKTVTTNSKIKGTSAYAGVFSRYELRKNIEFINGIGLQYGQYKVDRDMKNNYQQNTYKGKLNAVSGNVYSGVSYTHKLNDSLDVNVNSALSYTMISQGKATEDSKPLSLEIEKQNYNYLDGIAGIGLTKTVYSNESSSSLSGTISAIYGLTGYKNKDLTGKFKNARTNFDIKGEEYDKLSMTLTLDYNVKQNSGFNYGITGSYTKNDKENNISVGVKAGYRF